MSFLSGCRPSSLCQCRIFICNFVSRFYSDGNGRLLGESLSFSEVTRRRLELAALISECFDDWITPLGWLSSERCEHRLDLFAVEYSFDDRTRTKLCAAERISPGTPVAARLPTARHLSAVQNLRY